MGRIIGSFDSFRVEEAYNWRDDIMEITRRIVHETDEARLNNIAEHFNVDLSEIREFLEMKRKKMQKPMTNGDRIRNMTDAELADKFEEIQLKTVKAYGNDDLLLKGELRKYWLEWLKKEAEDGE